MLTDLSQLIGQVTESTAQFKDGSRVIAQQPRIAPANGATTSASVEQMTASIESLTVSFGAVTKRAQDANHLALKTSKLAEKAAPRSTNRSRP